MNRFVHRKNGSRGDIIKACIAEHELVSVGLANGRGKGVTAEEVDNAMKDAMKDATEGAYKRGTERTSLTSRHSLPMTMANSASCTTWA
jgi:hypothetical protein